MDIFSTQSPNNNLHKRHDTGVILHLYYPEMWNEILNYLAHLDKQFDLYVTIPYGVDISEKIIKDSFPDAQIYRCENRGRDVAPFLTVFSAISKLEYKYICKIHTKKSPHIINGVEWRQDVLGKLLGSPEIVKRIKRAFKEHPDWGLIAPQGHVVPHIYFWDQNAKNVLKLAHSVGIPTDNIEFSYVAGSMFWFRPQAFNLLLNTDILTQNFAREEGQQDGTLAHAFERLFGIVSNVAGYKIAESDSQEVKLADVSFHFRLLLEEFEKQEQLIETFSTEAVRQEEAIRSLSEQALRQEQIIIQKEHMIVQKEQQLAEKNNQIAVLNKTLTDILSSRGWRLLAPLRWLREQQLRADRLIRGLFVFLLRPANIFSLLRTTLNIWRKDGWTGVKSFLRFYTTYYIEMNPDVKAAGIKPLYHYLRSGKQELFPDVHDIPETYTPKVSVIVPNFNHSAYLEERLTSIYEQTYKNFEVILLDDCSTDDSISILRNYAAEYSEKTRCYFNDTNSGSPFSQWEKGISLAEGDLIWIAESDDFCEKDFLEKLVPLFFDDSVLLSYVHTVFVDAKGKQHIFAFENYVSQVNPIKWSASYVETAHNEVNTALGLINSIPNVSGVLFRKLDHHFPLFNDPEWKKMRVCGDWLFYLHLIRGGSVAYSRDTHNYYRMYPSSTSKKTHSRDIYYEEHERVAIAIASLYKIPSDLLVRLQSRLKDFYFKNVEDGSAEKFDEIFDLNKIIRSMQERKPNVLMAAFGLAFGGGEIFPIRLANSLHKAGAAVTLFNGGYEPTQSGVRGMVSPQIAVLTNHSAFPVNDMLEKFGIEVIHSHHASMENYFAVTRTIGSTGIKHISTMHGMYEMMSNFMHNTRSIRKSVEHWVYTADKNILPFTKHSLYAAEKFTKIENGLPSPNVQKVDLSPLGITSESFTACLATRALPDKGWFEAIEATKKTREITKKDVHLLLIGEGPVYDLLKKEQLPEFIHLLGYIANLDDYIASTQLGLLPTYFKGESFPLILIQFFMAELPVIASNIAEISRMIKVSDDQMGGALIELYNGKVNSDDLAEVMIKMVMDRDFYNKHAAAARLLKNRFDIDNIAQQYLAVYKLALGYAS